MRIEHIHLHHAPGLQEGLPPLDLPAGLLIIIGLNASGKSTLARAIRSTLWPNEVEFKGQVTSRWLTAQGTHIGNLVGGQVFWEPAHAFTIPATASVFARFGIRSLLADADKDDRDLAKQVARLLAGNLDLEEAERTFPKKAQLGTRAPLAKKMQKAEQELRAINQKAKDLAGKEEKLSRLQENIETARRSSQRHAASQELRQFVVATSQLADLDAKLGAFAEGIDQLVGNEDARIGELSGLVKDAEHKLRSIEETITTLEAKRTSVAFPDGLPNQEELGTWSSRLDLLLENEKAVQELTRAATAADQNLLNAQKKVLIEGDAADFEAADLATINQAIVQVRQAEGAREASRAAVAAWEVWAKDPETNADSIDGAIHNLRAWLRTPAVPGGSGSDFGPPAWLGWVLIVLGLGSLGVAILLLVPWASAGLVLAGLGLGLLLRSRNRPGSKGTGAQATYRQALERSMFEPRSWKPAEVERFLQDLEGRQSKIRLAGIAKDRLDAVRLDLDKSEEVLTDQKTVLKETTTNVGVAEEFVELKDLPQLHALTVWLAAETCHSEKQAELMAAREAYQEGFRTCGEWLQSLGIDEAADVSSAREALRTVEERRRNWITADKDLKRYQEDLEACAETLEEHTRERSDLWKSSGVPTDDFAALGQRLAEWKAWAALRELHREARQNVEICLGRFEQAGDLPEMGDAAPSSVSLEQVDEWIKAYQESAEQLGNLSGDQGAIKREVEIATEGHTLSDAIATVRAAEQAIAEDRELAAKDALARMLLEEAHEQQETHHAPVLVRAQEHFARFTHNQWQLQVDRSKRFTAVNVSAKTTHGLEQLSDGTRMQLLLAARLAALETLEEDSESVPICLDEALATTDPVRFQAIAEALFELADQGRQLLYFTADPNEAEQLKQACKTMGRPNPEVVDLSTLNGEPADWGGALSANPPALPPIPNPAGMTHDAYARALGISEPNGRLPVSDWHLYFLAHEDLDVLANCLRRRITRIGHWQDARKRGHTPSGIPSETVDRLDARAALCESLVRVWRRGRGTVLKWDEIQKSGAITPSFQEPVRELLVKHATDPRLFLQEVGHLKRFHSAKLADLERHLDSLECLPDKSEMLKQSDLMQRCLEDGASATDVLGVDKASAYVAWLAGLLGE